MEAAARPRWRCFTASAGLHVGATIAAVAYPAGTTITRVGLEPLGVRIVELASYTKTPLYAPVRLAGEATRAQSATGQRSMAEAMDGAAAAKRAEQTLIQPGTTAKVERVAAPRMTIVEPFEATRRFVRPPDQATADIRANTVIEMAPPSLTGRPVGIASPQPSAQPLAVLAAPAALRSPVAGTSLWSGDRASTVRGTTSNEAATIISIPERELPAMGSIAIPLANQGKAWDASAEGRTGKAVSGRSDHTGSDVAARETDVRTEKVGEAGRSSAGPNAANEGNESRATRALASTTGPGIASPAGATDTTAPSAPVMRIVRPFDRTKDFVITQSESAIPGSAGLLEGRPVYTVYIGVGTGQEWILQYSVATVAATERNGNVVRIESTTAVTAPYAAVIFRPAVQLRPGQQYGFVRGAISAAGRLEAVREAGDPAFADPSPLLRALQDWEFRPAMKDGQATRVEVLLCIPKS